MIAKLRSMSLPQKRNSVRQQKCFLYHHLQEKAIGESLMNCLKERNKLKEKVAELVEQ